MPNRRATGSAPGHILAVDQHPSVVGRLEAREQPERRRLPAPARAQQGEHLAPLERERQLVDRDGAVEPLGQLLEPEERRHSRPSFPVPRTCRSQ